MSCDNEAAGSSHFEGRSHCCPHVVDVEWFALFLGALSVGTIFLRNQITMNIAGSNVARSLDFLIVGRKSRYR